jgi:membrane protein YdbS with pleckstrin-like domain
MNCQRCGAAIPPGAAFCPGCGERVTDAAVAAAETSSPIGAEQLQHKTAQIRDARDIPEKELWRGAYSYKAMVGSAVGAGIITLFGLILLIWVGQVSRWIILAALLVMWLYIGLSAMRRRVGLRYRLTNQRFFIETGILRRMTERIEVIDINDMEFVQGFFERMFGIGSIKLCASDQSMPKVTLDGIEHVEEVFNLIDQARRAERNRRGLYIEAS